MSTILEQFSFSVLAVELGIKYFGPDSLTAKRFSTDTRTLQPGDLFVALTGDNFDGNNYIELAVEKGAVGVIAQKKMDGVPTFLSDDALLTMQNIAHFVFARFQEDLHKQGGVSIAITGSNGKTTTKELIKLIHTAFWPPVHATRGNLNNHIGLPLTIGEIPSSVNVAVFEMGANKPGDILELINIAPTDIRVLTSISEAHLEGFGDLQGVIDTKSEIFKLSSPKTIACIPEALRTTLNFDAFLGKVLSVGEKDLTKNADIEYVIIDPFTTRFTLHFDDFDDFEIQLRSPLAGSHNVLNLGLAIATLMASQYCLPHQVTLQNRLDMFQLPGSRSRSVKVGGHRIFDDAYNANTASIKASLSTWLEINPKQEGVNRIAIIGEMFEMGTQSQTIHEKLAEWIGKLDIDIVVFLGSFHERMVQASGQKTALGFVDAKMAAKWLKKRSSSEVFLKGSRGMKLETIIDDLRN